jgi:hypothetical protein
LFEAHYATFFLLLFPIHLNLDFFSYSSRHHFSKRIVGRRTTSPWPAWKRPFTPITSRYAIFNSALEDCQ